MSRDVDNLGDYQGLEEPLDLEITPADQIAVMRLTRDQKKAAVELKRGEARYLTDMYYNMQGQRIRAAAQVRSAGEEPNELITWMHSIYAQLELDMKSALGKYAESTTPGQWAMSQMGIGPVIAAGLLSHINIEIAETSGDVWRYAGLDPTCKWEKGQKRPWNASLKRLGYLAGESFVKTKNREKAFYGPLYDQRKKYEQEKNERGDYAEQAKLILETRNFRDDTIAKGYYVQGKLPPAHIHSRCRRWTVKMFFSHYFQVAYETHFHKQMPKPWVFAIAGHDISHFIAPPLYDLTELYGDIFH